MKPTGYTRWRLPVEFKLCFLTELSPKFLEANDMRVSICTEVINMHVQVVSPE